MSNKMILLLMPIKLREIDIFRYDINEYEKKSKCKVEIHELRNFLHPGFEKSFTNTIKDRRLSLIHI